uniref:Required for excision 1-B domain containing n=1 Tax=Rhinolophus ferrumequinum TaxID=59479 RepID=A0A671FXZ6_RHIFE
MLACILVLSTAARRSVATPTTYAPRRRSSGFRVGGPHAWVRRPPGLQGAPGAAEQPAPRRGRGCAVMITAEAAAESAIHTAPEAEAATGAPELEEPPWPWKDAPIQALVQRIHQLQAERAQAFRRLEEGHRQYLRSGPPYDFPRYRSKVHEVTQAFAAVSREVLAVEAELAGPRAQPLLAGHVRSLQQLEQTRLATAFSSRTRPSIPVPPSAQCFPGCPAPTRTTLLPSGSS